MWILKVVVATFAAAPSTSDELAERLALGQVAVMDREHVRAAEGGVAGGDAARLQALGKKLGADVVIGGDAKHVSVVEVSSGAAQPLPSGGAVKLALGFAEMRHLMLPETSTRPIPSSVRGYVEAARAALRADDFSRAGELAKKAVDAAPGTREPLLMAARAEDYANHDDAAIAAYREVLKVAPFDAVAHSNLGRLLVKRYEMKEAMVELKAAEESEPTWSLPSYNLAMMMMALDHPMMAAAALTPLVKADPERPEFIVQLARARRKSGDSRTAERLLRPLVELRPNDVGARAELALAIGAARLDGAEAVLGERTEPLLLVAHAQLLLEKGDADGAARLIEGQEQPAARKTLAVARLQQKRAAEAVTLLRPIAVGHDPEARYDLGLALEASGDAAGARAAWEKALALLPTHAQAALALGRARLDGGDAEGARKILESAVESHPDDGRLQLTLALAEWRLGTLDGDRFDRAMKDPRVVLDAECAYFEALYAAGRRDEARTQARSYLEKEKRAGHEAAVARARLIAK